MRNLRQILHDVLQAAEEFVSSFIEDYNPPPTASEQNMLESKARLAVYDQEHGVWNPILHVYEKPCPHTAVKYHRDQYGKCLVCVECGDAVHATMIDA